MMRNDWPNAVKVVGRRFFGLLGTSVIDETSALNANSLTINSLLYGFTTFHMFSSRASSL
ncbi:MAG: hypothetical protein ABJO27_14315 [Pseudoruegeria sp.]